jgi:O-antigen/teichoic acid export membrane protein
MDKNPHDGGSPAMGGGKLLKGAAVLGAAAVISKFIGTMQKVPLQNMAGDAVFGIYNAVYPLYILILFLATAGFPLVVSKFVSEQIAVKRFDEARRVLYVSIGVLTCTGTACFLFLYFGASWLADLMGAGQTVKAIRSVSFALLIVPVMSALRGYYQGYQNMIPTAVSQVIEQLVRVATMFSLLIVLIRLQYGPEWIAAGATFGSVTGAFAGLAVMLWYWRREPRPVQSRQIHSSESVWRLVRRLISYALPICVGSVAVPILTLVDSFTMPRLLKLVTGDETAALYQFGMYNHGLPLVQLVAMIASSMSAALVPAIAEAKWHGDRDVIRRRTEIAVRLTWFVGLAASFGLAVLAVPLNVMFFKSPEGSTAMAILGFTALFGTLNIVAGNVLQGCGSVVAPALYLLVAAVLKVAGNVLLIPRWGIDGAAISAVVSYLAAGGLTLAHALRVTGVTFTLAVYVYRPLIAVIVMSVGLVSVQAIGSHISVPERALATIVSITGVALGALLYGLTLLRLGVVSERELLVIPRMKDKHIALLRKCRLMK